MQGVEEVVGGEFVHVNWHHGRKNYCGNLLCNRVLANNMGF